MTTTTLTTDQQEAVRAAPCVVSFVVIGRPQQVGSKHAMVVKTRNGPKAVALDMNRKKAEPWMQAVRAAAVSACPPGFELFRGPVRVSVEFRFGRPKSHFRTGKRSHELRDDAPHWHATTPDADKAARALGDSLTGIVLADDKQICQWSITKVYTSGAEGASVHVSLLREGEA